MVDRIVDHVVIAGSDLERLRRAFADAGLATEYGGPHSNGVTHMDVLCCADGSYIELISTRTPGTPSPLWPVHIASDGGPAAWAVEVPDVAAEAARVAGLGVPTTPAFRLCRRRPDGVLAEWDMAGLGPGPLGTVLPFVIRDITPRELRVRPTRAVCTGAGRLTGVAAVVLAVADVTATVALFRRVYGWPEPVTEDNAALGATLAAFAGTPVVLELPNGMQGERLAWFGESPCAYLLATDDLSAARRRFALGVPTTWFGRPAAWFDPARLGGVRLGVVG